MKAWKFLLVAAIALFGAMGCKTGGGGSVAQEKVYLTGEKSLSAQVTWTKLYGHKLGMEIRFHNEGAEMVHFPFAGITIDYQGTTLAARGSFTKENDIDLLPGVLKMAKVYFHTEDAGLGAPVGGSYVVKVAGIMNADDSLVGTDLMIPVTVQ